VVCTSDNQVSNIFYIHHYPFSLFKISITKDQTYLMCCLFVLLMWLLVTPI